jgi:hypothetical protein
MKLVFLVPKLPLGNVKGGREAELPGMRSQAGAWERGKGQSMKRQLIVFLFCLAAAGCGEAAVGGKSGGTKPDAVTEAPQPPLDLGGLKSPAPADWKAEKPSNNMRLAQYKVPSGEKGVDDGQLVVSFFGAGSGGGVDENLKRWKSEFETGAKDAKEGKVDTFKVGAANVTVLDISGTWLAKIPPGAPNPKIERKADYRMFAVIFETAGGPYFIKLTGPAKTLENQKKAFDDWLKGFK